MAASEFLTKEVFKKKKKKRSPDSAVKTELGCGLLQPKPTLV